jgi:hydroxymethylpyrimidine pyrophosphatase-like HAD family hydrolase
MKIFCTDLDNTIIYSYKHDIGLDKVNVEIYQEREISFISEKTLQLLKNVKEEMLIIPTSTRTEQQYKRINLGIGDIKYALVCNGGVLLVNGKRDEKWYRESLELTKESSAELNYAMRVLETDSRRIFEIRFIDDLFVFTKCDNPEDVVKDLNNILDTGCVKIFNNGAKVYVVPIKLSKGMAIKRLRKYFNPTCIIAAGDSEFDVSMVEEADYGIVPSGFIERYGVSDKVIEMKEDILFSEALLAKCMMIKAELK